MKSSSCEPIQARGYAQKPSNASVPLKIQTSGCLLQASIYLWLCQAGLESSSDVSPYKCPAVGRTEANVRLIKLKQLSRPIINTVS